MNIIFYMKVDAIFFKELLDIFFNDHFVMILYKIRLALLLKLHIQNNIFKNILKSIKI